MKRSTVALAVLSVAFTGVSSTPQSTDAQSSQRYRLLRSISGSKSQEQRGLYRVDIIVGAEPAWRGYLKISE